jgi:hypothetical protein
MALDDGGDDDGLGITSAACVSVFPQSRMDGDIEC